MEELRRSRARLDRVEDIRAYAELTHGMAIHAVAVGAWRHHGLDQDSHQGMVRWLRERGYAPIGTAFAEIESLRTGRWYGRQGNGDAADRLDELLAKVEEWALA